MRLDELRTALQDDARLEPVDVEDGVAAVMRRVRRDRRRRRGRGAAAAVVVVALAACAVAFASRGHSSDRTEVATVPPDGARIAVITTEPLRFGANLYASHIDFIDPATGAVRRVEVDENNYADYPVQLRQVGDRLLLPGGGALLAAPLDLSSPPEVVAPALVFVPSAKPDRVWTISVWQPGNVGPYTLTEVDVDGTPTAGPAQAPDEAGWPIVGTDIGLVLSVPMTEEAIVWDPGTGQVIRRIPGVDAFQGNGWGTASLFAWVGPCGDGPPRCDTLHVLDLGTGQQRTIGPPSGTTGFVPDGAVAPDGRSLALFTTGDDGGQRLVLVDLIDGSARAVPGSEAGGSGVGWAVDGSTVYFGQDGSTAVAGYRLGDAAARPVRTGLPRFSALATIDPERTGG